MKILLILVFIISLSSLSLSQDCKVAPQKTFNLLEGYQLKNYVSDGILCASSQSDIIWGPSLPQPKQNALLRFKFQAHTDKQFFLFTPRSGAVISVPDNLVYFNLNFQGKQMTLYFNYGNYYQDLTVDLNDLIYQQPEWLSIYFEKNQISVYYEKQLLAKQDIKHPEFNNLAMFSTDDLDFTGYYEIYESQEGSVQISDLYVFNDLTDQEAKCLLWQDKSRMDFIGQLAGFLNW